MTPYRDEQDAPHDRIATRWFIQSRARAFLFVLAAVAFVVAGASLMLLRAPIALLAALPAFIFATLAEQAVRRFDVGRDRVVIREGFLRRKVVRSLSTAEGGEVRVTKAAGFHNVGTSTNPRTRPYVAHLVELHTPQGSWTLFESDDPARANAMAEFVRTSLPLRLRVESSSELRIAAHEDELLESEASEPRAKENVR